MAAILAAYFTADGLVERCLDFAAKQEHVMDFTNLRALGSLFSMLNQATRDVLKYNHSHSDFPMQVADPAPFVGRFFSPAPSPSSIYNVFPLHLQQDQLERFIPRMVVYSLIWSFTGDGKNKVREDLGNYIRSITTIPMPANTSQPIIDFEVRREWTIGSQPVL